MSRIKAPREDDFIEENLIGKSIVDPKGNIIAKCIGLIVDEKKNTFLRISIKTEIGSDFIVDETIPINNISKVGEVILLKKAITIKEIPIEEIVSFEILDKDVEPRIEEEISEENNQTFSMQKDLQINSVIENVKVSTNESIPLPIDNRKDNAQQRIGEILPKKEKQKPKATLEELFNNLRFGENEEYKEIQIKQLIDQFSKGKSQHKKIMTFLFEKISTPDFLIRYNTALILNALAYKSHEILFPYLTDAIISVYNEPSKEIERLILDYLIYVAAEIDLKSFSVDIDDFFENLIIQRKICKSISLKRIHSLNLKIFVNNFDIQEIIIKKYLLNIISNPIDENEFVNLLKDYNAVMIAYSLIYSFNHDQWPLILNAKNIIKTFDGHFIDMIGSILYNFSEGNIKQLNEIINPKLGYAFSKKIITNMIKLRMNDFLTNTSVLPLEVLTAFFQDDENQTIQILFELINAHELDAQIIFIGDKTYISNRFH